MVDAYIRDKLDLVARSDSAKENAASKEREYRVAKQLLSESLAAEENLSDLMTERYGPEAAAEVIQKQRQPQSTDYAKFDVFDQEKFGSFTRVVTQLAAEGRKVSDGLDTLERLAAE